MFSELSTRVRPTYIPEYLTGGLKGRRLTSKMILSRVFPWSFSYEMEKPSVALKSCTKMLPPPVGPTGPTATSSLSAFAPSSTGIMTESSSKVSSAGQVAGSASITKQLMLVGRKGRSMMSPGDASDENKNRRKGQRAGERLIIFHLLNIDMESLERHSLRSAAVTPNSVSSTRSHEPQSTSSSACASATSASQEDASGSTGCTSSSLPPRGLFAPPAPTAKVPAGKGKGKGIKRRKQFDDEEEETVVEVKRKEDKQEREEKEAEEKKKEEV